MKSLLLTALLLSSNVFAEITGIEANAIYGNIEVDHTLDTKKIAPVSVEETTSDYGFTGGIQYDAFALNVLAMTSRWSESYQKDNVATDVDMVLQTFYLEGDYALWTTSFGTFKPSVGMSYVKFIGDGVETTTLAAIDPECNCKTRVVKEKYNISSQEINVGMTYLLEIEDFSFQAKATQGFFGSESDLTTEYSSQIDYTLGKFLIGYKYLSSEGIVDYTGNYFLFGISL